MKEFYLIFSLISLTIVWGSYLIVVHKTKPLDDIFEHYETEEDKGY